LVDGIKNVNSSVKDIVERVRVEAVRPVGRHLQKFKQKN
jgi:hypothetical protein